MGPSGFDPESSGCFCYTLDSYIRRNDELEGTDDYENIDDVCTSSAALKTVKQIIACALGGKCNARSFH